MALIGNLYPTLKDVVNRLDPNGAVASVVEHLQLTLPMHEDIPWIEGNLPTGHRYTTRTALPGVSWRRYNEGVKPSKSETQPAEETAGQIAGRSIIDKDLADLNGNAAAFRASEDKAFLQSFNEEFERAIIYESTKTNPGRVMGLEARYGYTSGNPAAGQIIKGDASASGSNQTSIWLCGWGTHTACCFYPKGKGKAGLVPLDRGLQTITDEAGGRYEAWETAWSWDFGVLVQDWRYIARACNIDVNRWKADLSQGANLPMLMTQLWHQIKELNSVQAAYYMNRATLTMLQLQLQVKGTQNFLQWIDRPNARPVLTWLGVPIRVNDKISVAEGVVS